MVRNRLHLKPQTGPSGKSLSRNEEEAKRERSYTCATCIRVCKATNEAIHRLRHDHTCRLHVYRRAG